MNLVSPSILNIEENKLNDILLELNNSNCEYIHFDVMDGIFVNNIAYSSDDLKKVKNVSKKSMDIHLMVKDLDRYINDFLRYNPDIITFHLEACKDINEVYKYINLIKNNNVKVGISIKPNTKEELIYPYLKDIDLALIMSVEPGYGGQKFIDSTIEKIKNVSKFIKENELRCLIEADGGINNVNGKEAVLAGANILVAGSYIFKSNDIKGRIDSLKYE